MPFSWKAFRKRPARSSPRYARLSLERLESRVVLYGATGNLWPDQQLITLSFMPDGTLMGSGSNGNTYSDMFAKFNTRWSVSTWETEVLKAAQVWAQAANINFTVVADNGTASGQGAYQQGDPGMSDIRFGTTTLGSNYLGMASLPPPVNNYSIAGDITFNDAQTYGIGSGYDLQSVAMHEVGHALGLDHSSIYGAVMYASYNGTKRALTNDEIAGAQAVYGARQPDAYEGLLGNNSFLTASVLTPLIDPLTSTVQVNADVSTTADKDYYLVTAPLGSSQLTVDVQSLGLSLLKPSLTVYAGNLLTPVLGTATVVGQATGTGYLGGDLTVTIDNVTPGQVYYIKVAGADTTAFGTGRYALSVSTGSSGLPAVTAPITQLLNGIAISSGGGLAELAEGGEAEAQVNNVDFYSIVDEHAAVSVAAVQPPAVAAPSVLASPSVLSAPTGAASPSNQLQGMAGISTILAGLQGRGAEGQSVSLATPSYGQDRAFLSSSPFLDGSSQGSAGRTTEVVSAGSTDLTGGASSSSRGHDQDPLFEQFGRPDSSWWDWGGSNAEAVEPASSYMLEYDALFVEMGEQAVFFNDE